ncbi:MAG: DUF6364 family protein [Bacteroidales bacterium]|nr:DUF6364 family protein [Bacteroidales bacterium]
MNSKLTLYINKTIIEKAKSYAKQNQLSLSKLVENYLSSLFDTSDKQTKRISPLVENLTGVISLESDEKETYHDYLSEKYS